MILDILPWTGLGPLRFGMKPNEVRRAFDEDQVYEDWMGGNLNDSLLYRGLILGFDKEDSRGPLKDPASARSVQGCEKTSGFLGELSTRGRAMI